MLNNMVKSEKPIDITDIVVDAMHNEMEVSLTIGDTEISGIITDTGNNNITLKVNEIYISVIF